MGEYSFSQTSASNFNTATAKMFRLVIGCLLVSTLHPAVLAATSGVRDARQYQQVQGQQPQYAQSQERQGIGANLDVNTPFGGINRWQPQCSPTRKWTSYQCNHRI